MIESGDPGLSLTFWAGLWALAGTPDAVVRKLNAEVDAVLRSPDMTASLARLGVSANPGSVADFAAFIAAETPKWENIVRVSGVKVD